MGWLGLHWGLARVLGFGKKWGVLRGRFRGRVFSLVRGGGFRVLGRVLSRLGPTSVTVVLRRISRGGLTVIFHVLPGRLTSRIFIRVRASDRRFLVRGFASGRLGSIVSRLFVSSTISVVRRVPTAITGHVLTRASINAHGIVGRLLTCSSGDTNDVVAARCVSLGGSVAISTTLREVHHHNVSDRVVCALCIVSTHQHLLKVMSVGSLLLGRGSDVVSSVVRRGVVFTGARSGGRSMTALFRGCSLVTLPIISGRGQLVNVVAISSTVSIVRRTTARSVRGVTTVAPARGSCFGANIFDAFGSHVL